MRGVYVQHLRLCSEITDEYTYSGARTRAPV